MMKRRKRLDGKEVLFCTIFSFICSFPVCRLIVSTRNQMINNKHCNMHPVHYPVEIKRVFRVKIEIE